MGTKASHAAVKTLRKVSLRLIGCIRVSEAEIRVRAAQKSIVSVELECCSPLMMISIVSDKGNAAMCTTAYTGNATWLGFKNA